MEESSRLLAAAALLPSENAPAGWAQSRSECYGEETMSSSVV